MNEGGDTVYDVDITPNRVDAMNHYGVARDCAAIYNVDLKPATAQLPATERRTLRIEIADAELCARYTARIVRGVTIKPSPEYMSRSASRCWHRVPSTTSPTPPTTHFGNSDSRRTPSISTCSKATRSSFDVRMKAKSSRRSTASNAKLTKDDLVIADAKKAVAIAGVMGGFDTMITDKTKNVLIEVGVVRSRDHSPHFAPSRHAYRRIAPLRTWRRLGSLRTRRNRVAQFILEAAGGQLEGDLIDAVGREVERPTLTLHRKEIKRILGQDITEFEIERILRLGFGVTAGRQHAVAASHGTTTGVGGTHTAVAEEAADFTVQVPTWRLDVEREIDLIEEVARIYGFDKFPNTLPVFSGGAVRLPDERKRTDLRRRPALARLQPGHLARASSRMRTPRPSPAMQAVEIANPLSEEASVMRTSMVPSMLDMLGAQPESRRKRREAVRIRQGLREARRAYWRIPPSRHRRDRQRYRSHVHQPARAYNFFDLKGDIETLLDAFQYNSVYFDSHTADYYHPGRSARVVIDGTTIGQFGQIHPRIAADRKLRQDVFVAELDLERLFKHDLRERHYTPIPRYPAVDRDFSFLFDDSRHLRADTRCGRGLESFGICAASCRSKSSAAATFRVGSTPSCCARNFSPANELCAMTKSCSGPRRS